MGIMVLRPSLSAMNSASVVLKAISVCIFDAYDRWQVAYFTTYSVLDFSIVLSRCAVSAFQYPLKSASHKISSELLVGSIILPSGLVAIKYLPILRIAILCDAFGFGENLVH